MSEETPEPPGLPWRWDRGWFRIVDANGRIVAQQVDPQDGELIVACVNAGGREG